MALIENSHEFYFNNTLIYTLDRKQKFALMNRLIPKYWDFKIKICYLTNQNFN